jgi:cytochrome c55X
MLSLATALPLTVLALAGPVPDGARQSELLHLVLHDCGSCHGMTLNGGLGNPLLPDVLAGKPADALADVILDGVPGTPMPPWRGLITRDEAVWIADQLKEGLVE